MAERTARSIDNPAPVVKAGPLEASISQALVVEAGPLVNPALVVERTPRSINNPDTVVEAEPLEASISQPR